MRVWDLAPGVVPPFSAVLACELEPAGRVGEHVQQHDPEIVLGIRGVGTALVNGQPHALVEGAVISLPFGSSLAIRNEDENAPLRYLIIKASLAR